jgi:two-component system, response regulator RegA
MSNSPAPFSQNALTLLVVDDHDILRQRLVRAFSDRGYLCAGAANSQEALEKAKVRTPDLVVVDLRMPGPSGLELIRSLKADHPSAKIVMLTGYGSITTAVEAIRLGAINVLPKPADADDILAAFSIKPTATKDTDAPDETPSLARTEWEHIQRVLGDCEGNISEAARRLGLHRRSLQRKLQKYPPMH